MAVSKSIGFILILLLLATDSLMGIEKPITMILSTLPEEQWMQRETRYFHIIHTETLTRDAGFLAMVLDDIFTTVNADLIPEYPAKKWPIILSDVGMKANGFVTLLPRRTIWYSTPLSDKYMSTKNWFFSLARHEGRHQGLFDMVNSGAVHVLRLFMGETGTSFGLFASYPPWFIEGDAIYIETLYSDEGRGRDPMFFRDMALFSLEKPEIKYSKIASESLGAYQPNRYRLGYEIVRWMRKNYTDNSIKLLVERAPEISIPLVALDAGMKNATRLKTRDVFKRMYSDLAKETTQFKNANKWSHAEVLGKESKWYTIWDSIMTDNGNIFAVRRTTGNAPVLIRILPDGTEKNIMRVPWDGDISMVPMMHNGKPGYRVIWSSYRPHPSAFTISSVDLAVTDIDDEGKRLKRFYPQKGTRLTSPELSPDGKRFAAVEYPRGKNNRIVILETASGNILDTIELPLWTSTSSVVWAPGGDKLVFVLRTTQGFKLTEWETGTKKLYQISEPTTDFIRFPVYTPDETEIVYSSNTGGIESIWAVNRDTGKKRNIVRRWYTASKPWVSPDGHWLYFAEYSSAMGERLARVPLSSSINEAPVAPAGFTTINNESGPPVPDPHLVDTEKKISELAEQGQSEYPEKRFKPIAHGLRLHSWGILFDYNNLADLLLGVQFTDLLGTMNLQFGGLFNYTELVPGIFANVSFIGFRPNINIDSNYMLRSIKNETWNTVSGGINLAFPMILSRNGISYHTLTPRIEASAVWSDRDEPKVEPLLEYGLNWSNLQFGGTKAFRPELGWMFTGYYAHYPIGTGDMISVDLRLHFPGGFRNTYLTLRGAAERQTADGNILSRIGKPRGYDWSAPEFLFKSSIDYDFPLYYPDLPLGSVLYIQRFRFNLHSDFAWTGNADVLWESGKMEQLWSSGIKLNIDMAMFNYLSGFSLSFRVDWLWRDEKAVFSIEIETDFSSFQKNKRAFERRRTS